jgi:hypothetical protein
LRDTDYIVENSDNHLNQRYEVSIMTNAKENQLEINKAVSTLKTNLKKLRSNATE